MASDYAPAPEPRPPPAHLYKILAPLPALLTAAAALPPDATLPGTELDARDGYVHLATRAQVGFVLGRFYDVVEEVVVVKLPYPALVAHAAAQPSTGTTDAQVKWEAAAAGVFAHLYGAELVGAVVAGWRVLRRERTAEEGRGFEAGLAALEGEGWFVE